MKTFFAPKQHQDEKYRVVETYETASAIGSLISGIGWLVAIIPIIAATAMLSDGYYEIETKLAVIGSAALAVVFGLVVVAVGQIARAIVDTAKNTAAILRRLERDG